MEQQQHLFGFTEVSQNGQDCVQYFHCSFVMANASLRPSKLKKSFEKKHFQRNNDNVIVLSAKRVRYYWKVLLPHFAFFAEEKPGFQCRCEMMYRIAKCEKPHTIAEELIKPCAEKMVELIIGPGAKKKIQQLSMSNDTICRRVMTWQPMCAKKLALKSSKSGSRLAYNWMSLPTPLLNAT